MFGRSFHVIVNYASLAYHALRKWPAYLNVSTVLPGDNYLLYADDTKIFRQIQGPDDHRILQAWLEDFDIWCTRNSLTICVDKCVTIIISWSRSPVHFDHTLTGHILQRVDYVKDLDVFVDAKLTFEQHLDHVVTRCSQLLGLFVNSTRELSDPIPKLPTTLVFAGLFGDSEHTWRMNPCKKELKIVMNIRIHSLPSYSNSQGIV